MNLDIRSLAPHAREGAAQRETTTSSTLVSYTSELPSVNLAFELYRKYIATALSMLEPLDLEELFACNENWL